MRSSSAIDVDPARIEKRLKSGYCDKIARSLDEAMQLIDAARAKREALSVGLVGNCADVLPEMVEARNRSRYSDRSNQRARCAQWLRA